MGLQDKVLVLMLVRLILSIVGLKGISLGAVEEYVVLKLARAPV